MNTWICLRWKRNANDAATPVAYAEHHLRL